MQITFVACHVTLSCILSSKKFDSYLAFLACDRGQEILTVQVLLRS